MVKVNIRRYEAPVTHRVLVELESGFCESANVTNLADEPQNGIENHAENTGFNTSKQWKNSNWGIEPEDE